MSDLNGFQQEKDTESRLDNFLDDLSTMLSKYFGNDWEWRFNSGEFLIISSDSMIDLWDDDITEWERRRHAK